MQIIAKTLEGLESVIAKEIEELGGTDIEILRRAVSYEGDWEMVYRSNYLLRTALRVLVPFDHFQALDDKALYERVTELPWEDLMDLKHTFAIDSVTSGEFFTHSKYAALKTKDAIVDRYYRLHGKRPNVNVHNPDFRINLHIRKRTVTISLDSSGESLHKRGYRIHSVEAPVNEVLAAGMVLLSGWKGETPLLDPMCGSGTILIEAARIAMDQPPQLADRPFAFTKWINFDKALWQEIQDSHTPRAISPTIVGRDKSMRNMRAAQYNIEEAGLTEHILVERANFFTKIYEERPLTIITNPPYDERLGLRDAEDFYQDIGDTLKKDYTDTTAWLISGFPEAFKTIGLRASKKHRLYNGKIPTQYHKYEMYAGSR